MSPATGDEPKDVTDPAPVCSRHDRYPAQRGLGLLASGEAAVEVSGTGLDEPAGPTAEQQYRRRQRNRCGRHGPPQRALDWLQHAIAAQRETPRPGDVVITGGVTAAVPVERGDVVKAMLGNSSITVRLHRLRAR